MKTKTLYTCEICHTDYADKKAAETCEKSHKTKLEIISARYLAVKVPIMSGKDGFPVTITVKGENGETVTYKR